MKEKINQLILETKNVPSVHISNKEGFDKLVSSFKVLKHLRKSSFTFEPIDETSIKELIKELKEVTTFCLKKFYHNLQAQAQSHPQVLLVPLLIYPHIIITV